MLLRLRKNQRKQNRIKRNRNHRQTIHHQQLHKIKAVQSRLQAVSRLTISKHKRVLKMVRGDRVMTENLLAMIMTQHFRGVKKTVQKITEL